MKKKLSKKQKKAFQSKLELVNRQKQAERDLQATEIMVLRILGELHKHEGYGPKRLKRLYDYLLLESHKDRILEAYGLVTNANDSYYSWGIKNGLTPREFEERQQKALAEWELELRKILEDRSNAQV